MALKFQVLLGGNLVQTFGVAFSPVAQVVKVVPESHRYELLS